MAAVAESLEIEIDHLDASGDGIARLGRRQIAVPFTIPGERVRVRIVRADGHVVRASLESVLRASPHRVAPGCLHFGPDAQPGLGPCGGCSWQHIAYAEQLRLKTDLVTRLVRSAVPRAPAAQPMLAGAPEHAPWGYRHKAHFVFGSAQRGPSRHRNRSLVMGHYARGSRRVIPVEECPVHDERGNALAFRLHDSYARANVGAAPDGPLKGIAIRAGLRTPELMATLVLTRESDKTVRAATRRVLDGPGAPSSFHVNLHPGPDPFIFGSETRNIAGPARMREEVAGVSFVISPTAFFQTNVHAAETLVGLVLAAMPERARILDLYAGAGLFALPLARAGHEVVAVEENRAAVADGEASRRFNRIPEERCRFVARRVEQAVTAPARSPGGRRDRRDAGAAHHEFDAVVLDPPREGCSEAVIADVFGGLAPPRVVYISCNPEALARDLAAASDHGYRIRSLQPVDMFPHTAHVETVALLTR